MSPVRPILLALWATLVGAVAQESAVGLTDRLAEQSRQLFRLHNRNECTDAVSVLAKDNKVI